MTQYLVNKKELHELLKQIGILKPDEEILMVNNIELRDFSAEFVSILVDSLKTKNIYALPPDQLTEKELLALHEDVSAFAQFMILEFQQIQFQLAAVRAEMDKRTGANDVNTDGIPRDVDTKLADELKDILGNNNQNPPNENV
jgi:hypothetical protein